MQYRVTTIFGIFLTLGFTTSLFAKKDPFKKFLEKFELVTTQILESPDDIPSDVASKTYRLIRSSNDYLGELSTYEIAVARDYVMTYFAQKQQLPFRMFKENLNEELATLRTQGGWIGKILFIELIERYFFDPNFVSITIDGSGVDWPQQLLNAYWYAGKLLEENPHEFRPELFKINQIRKRISDQLKSLSVDPDELCRQTFLRDR